MFRAPGAGYDYKTAEAARGKVDEIAKKGADMIKVWVDPQDGEEPRGYRARWYPPSYSIRPARTTSCGSRISWSLPTPIW